MCDDLRSPKCTVGYSGTGIPQFTLGIGVLNLRYDSLGISGLDLLHAEIASYYLKVVAGRIALVDN